MDLDCVVIAPAATGQERAADGRRKRHNHTTDRILRKASPAAPSLGAWYKLWSADGEDHLHNSTITTEIRTRQGSATPPARQMPQVSSEARLVKWVKAWAIRGRTKGGSTRCRKRDLAIVLHLDCLAADLIAELNDFLRCRRERLTAATSFC
jgi:hypothetical protein